MVDDSIDTAIVGGGVSGVYSAWRLKQAHPGARIVVFEGICGEAYSDAQGWVEGALQTADLMLDRLGLPPA